MGSRQLVDMLAGLSALLVLNFTAWLMWGTVPETQIGIYSFMVVAMNTGLVVGIYARVRRRR